jgi:SPP1 family predicted phage head-tail adaptor
MSIQPGSLRERVTVQTASETRNTLGETTLTWGDWKTVWASVEGVSSREVLSFGQQEISITHRVRMRYLEGLKQTARFRWRNRTLNIVSLLEYDHRAEHVAICEETA